MSYSHLIVGINCILVFQPKFLQHTHEYFGVSFTSFKNQLIGESDFVGLLSHILVFFGTECV
jgi:hypothetical protein